ncbi:DUF1365 family protein [Nannocystaceae bacterium ST9]
MAAAPPDIDLQDPEQLAALLNAALPDDEDHGVEQIREQLGTLVESDNPAFANLNRAPTGAPVDDPNAGDVPDDPNAGEGPEEESDDVQFEPTGLGARSSPVRPSDRPWNEWDRRRAKDKYTLYRLDAKHVRREPIKSAFTGQCQAVRVTLPANPIDKDSYIGTFIGKVEARDHLLFSVKEVREFHERTFGKPIAVERVDLITGARYLGRRFSPVSIFLAYAKADRPDQPCFFVLEGGSASGQPKALYAAKDMTTLVHQKAGFSFTPLTCANNWYKGGVEMKPDMEHPARVFLTSAQQADGKFDYIDLSVRYTVSKDPRRVIAPFELQVEAAMRVLAIAEQIGCELKQGSGGGMQPVLGPMAEATLPWDTKPQGSTNAGERARYCGCPKTGATSVDPTPPLPSAPTPSGPPERSRDGSSTRAGDTTPPARPGTTPARKPPT